ncbi:MAG: glycosyltransferase family 2 protein [Chloroflexi bacterium]|nr:glycosyltransferase family 2 protein [Chloroflexota bacterium]
MPAYNEERRLPATLPRALAYLTAAPLTWELLLVDDGSADGTLAIMRAAAADCPAVRVLAEPHRGKAAAVRAGVLAARGDAVLFTDADLSTPLATVEAMLPLLKSAGGAADGVIGSREGLGARRHDEPLYRHVMGRVFNLLVRWLAVPGIHDTQCGFKLFTRGAGQDLFHRLRLYGDDAPRVRGPLVTGFDVELLFLARKRGYAIVEQPVAWQHVPGSKVDPLRDAYRMARDVLRVRLNDLRGVYDR